MTQKELFAIIGDMPQTSPNCAAKCFRVRPRGSSSKAGRPGGRAPVSRGPCAGNRQSLQSLPTRVLQATCRSSRKRGRLAKPSTVGLTATLRHRHHIGQSWQERCDGCSEHSRLSEVRCEISTSSPCSGGSRKRPEDVDALM